MIDLTKLLRGAFLALALLFLAPLSGVGGSLIGVEAAQAATVSKVSIVGNSKVDKGAILKYLALHVGERCSRWHVHLTEERPLAETIASPKFAPSRQATTVSDRGPAALNHEITIIVEPPRLDGVVRDKVNQLEPLQQR